jgi:RNA polymerase sigma-70 factor (ECF subfamily)
VITAPSLALAPVLLSNLRARLPTIGSVSGEADERGDAATRAFERVREGDEHAFAEFYDHVAPTVFGVILRVLRDRAQAEEVTQEVFVELWRTAPRFDPSRGSVRSWANTMAHRRAVDRVRSEQSARDREVADGARAARSQEDVADRVVIELDRADVTEALGALSDTQREAVSLAFYGGLTYREVATRLAIPEGTAKTRIRDGLTKLRDLMGAAS